MPSVAEIIAELNLENGSKYKLAVLKKYQDHKELKRVLQMTYDSVRYTYGLSQKQLTPSMVVGGTRPLSDGLNFMADKLATREVTGHNARDGYMDITATMSDADRDVMRKILNRDLRINCGRSQINKVWRQLITKPAYMRCGLYSAKTANKINWPAILQLKADGTYREFQVEAGRVSCTSRSGESYEYPALFSAFQNAPEGHYFGELTVVQNGKVLDRATGNGMINSSDVPHEDLVFECWDFVTSLEYQAAIDKRKKDITSEYKDRWAKVQAIVLDVNHPQIQLIETVEVQSLEEALQQTSKWMTEGKEGGILKDKGALFKDGTSPGQLKLKMEIDLEVRITGFIEGTPGTKREATFGSVTFETDDGLIKGSCSGFSDSQLEDFNNRREELIGQIFTVQCTDITKGRDSEHWALSHPRFIELRPDRNDTDTLARAQQTKEMAYGVIK